jgi:hypothetical protein
MTALVAAAMLADLLTFAAVIEVVGIGAELNPVMASGYTQGGIAIVAALKLAALAAIVLLVARCRRPRLRVLAAGIAIVVGVTGAASNVTAWAASTPRSAQLAVPSAPAAGVSPAPGRTEGPRQAPRSLRAVPPVRIMPSAVPVAARSLAPSVTATMPAVDEASARTAAGTITGIATWFRSPQGVSAAGPALRSALGPGWRGTSVQVCHDERCVVTVLGDFMRADRLVDLDAPLFARLAPLSVGVLAVTLTVIPEPPPTSTRETP